MWRGLYSFSVTVSVLVIRNIFRRNVHAPLDEVLIAIINMKLEIGTRLKILYFPENSYDFKPRFSKYQLQCVLWFNMQTTLNACPAGHIPYPCSPDSALIRSSSLRLELQFIACHVLLFICSFRPIIDNLFIDSINHLTDIYYRYTETGRPISPVDCSFF
jgi:hypothetical protein